MKIMLRAQGGEVPGEKYSGHALQNVFLSADSMRVVALICWDE